METILNLSLYNIAGAFNGMGLLTQRVKTLIGGYLSESVPLLVAMSIFGGYLPQILSDQLIYCHGMRLAYREFGLYVSLREIYQF